MIDMDDMVTRSQRLGEGSSSFPTPWLASAESFVEAVEFQIREEQQLGAGDSETSIQIGREDFDFARCERHSRTPGVSLRSARIDAILFENVGEALDLVGCKLDPPTGL